MKYILIALSSLFFIIAATCIPVQAYNFKQLPIESSVVPIENNVTNPPEVSKYHKKKKHKTKPSNKKKRLIYTILIIAGFVLALLSIVLIILLAPTVGTITAGVVIGVAKYFGWIAFAICTLGSFMLIWIGFLLLNNTPKADAPLTPTEQLIEDNSKKFPNFPEQKVEEYVALEEEVKALQKEKEELEGKKSTEAKERLNTIDKELEIKQKKQVFLEELNKELGTIPDQNRIEYIFLKEEILTLTTKKEALQNSSAEDAGSKIEKIDIRINEDLKKLNALK